jgi:L-rhamnose mutarotase
VHGVSRRYFALDLKDDSALIAEYERWHSSQRLWPEVVAVLCDAGIRELEIFRCGNRLVMVLEAAENFVFGQRPAARMAEWEALMWRFQQALPFAEPGQKWVPMQRMFSLQQVRQEQKP